LEDNGRRGLVGLEGKVVSSIPGSVIVELENDPMLFFRATMLVTKNMARPQRHFRVTEVERA